LRQTQAFVTFIGATTAFFAATVGLRRTTSSIVAYSTCSQLGYMFVAMGSGPIPSACFTCSAFFKALLFLGSGSVITARTTSRTSA
jgi:NADH-quinone oxidoreductase subunit L